MKFPVDFSIAYLFRKVTSMEFGLSKRRNSARSCPEKEGWMVVFKNLLLEKNYLFWVLFHFL